MGVWITEDLLRKSSEHNDCIIGSMEEVALHQRDIDRITLLNSACRELRIVYLQNNNIQKIENINRLKELRYLNLAINKVRQFEGLHRCEFLGKLDMTLNRVDARGLLTMERLSANTLLLELYMTGNSCCLITDENGVDVYRPFAIAVLPSLTTLDGKEVLKSERTQALQVLDHCRKVIEAAAAQEDALPEAKHPMDYSSSDSECSDDDEDVEEIESEGVKRQKEMRAQARRERHRARDEEHVKDASKPSDFDGYGQKMTLKATTPGLERKADGKVRQCNEGHYKFKVDERDECIVVELSISKFLDTSMIEVDVHPDFVRMVVKGKVTQLHLPQECRTDTSHTQRSTTTGALVVTCPRLYPVMRRKPLVGTTNDEKQAGGKYSRSAKVLAPRSTGGVGTGEYKRIAEDSPCIDLTADIKEVPAAAPAPAFNYRDSEIDDDAPPDW